jgi:hypothetical protein
LPINALLPYAGPSDLNTGILYANYTGSAAGTPEFMAFVRAVLLATQLVNLFDHAFNDGLPRESANEPLKNLATFFCGDLRQQLCIDNLFHDGFSFWLFLLDT